jgi:hypothetical protein
MTLLPLSFGCETGPMTPPGGNGNANGNANDNDNDNANDNGSENSNSDGGSASTARSFLAQLTGAAEVPPADSTATGSATFMFNEAGDTMTFSVRVDDGLGITAAHIHSAPVGVNGGVVVTLFSSSSADGVVGNGVIADGTRTADDLEGSLAGGTLDDLLALLRSGDSYVNVHTVRNPAGEVRGQIADDE